MVDTLQRGVVRLFRGDGAAKERTLGTGFLVQPDGLVVTCAHVLENEPGVRAGERPVALEFYANGARATAHVLPQYWRPSDREDVAVLRIDASASPGAVPPPASDAPGAGQESAPVAFLPLGFSDHLRNASPEHPRKLKTFGFPVKPNMGLPGVCEVVGVARDNGFEVFTNTSEQVTHGFSGSPVWDDQLCAVVGVNVSIVEAGVDRAGRLGSTSFFIPVETVRSACDLLQLPDGQPYRNLDAFEEEHARFYFGREAESARLVELISEHDIVAVIGVSGSGKSSLVRAGLVNGLTVAGSRLLHRRRVRLRAGADPLVAVIAAIERQAPAERPKLYSAFGLPDGAAMSEVMDQLRDRPAESLAAALRRFAADVPLVLVCDQFERLYTERTPDPVRQQFVETLLRAACQDVKVVIAVRADYYFSHTINEKGWANALGDAELILKSMSPEQLGNAIERPARLLFRSIDPAVVRDMVQEVRERPGDLPLLQFALTELWKLDSAKGRLTERSYQELGVMDSTGKVLLPGVRGAIVRRANDYYRNLYDDEARARCKRLFHLLIDVHSAEAATAAQAVGRRVLASELDDATLKLADGLAETFLLTAREDPTIGQRTFEVAHEALIRSWPLLTEWTEEERRWGLWYQTVLYPEYRQWLSQGCHPDFYIRSRPVLEEAKRWLRRQVTKQDEGRRSKTSSG